MKKIKNNKKGFTLIEMIVVIVIIAILVALAVPAVMGYVQDARDAKLRTAANAGTTTMQAAMAKAESTGKLSSEYAGIITSGEKAAGTETGGIVVCKDAISTGTCSNVFDAAAEKASLDDIKTFIFTIGDKVVYMPATGGGEAAIVNATK